MTINELTVFHDVPWSSTIRINFQNQFALQILSLHLPRDMISWFILLVYKLPAKKIFLSISGFLLKDQGFNQKTWKFPHFPKKLGDFEAWSFRTPIPLTMKDLIVGQKPTEKLKLFGFMTCLMLFISDGLWTWFLILMVWSKLEELTVTNIYTLHYLHTNIFF